MVPETSESVQDCSFSSLKALPAELAARQKLEFLLADLEGDVMLCSTRDQHIRAVQRVESLKAALNVLT